MSIREKVLSRLREERGDINVILLYTALIVAMALGLVVDVGGAAVRARTEASTAAREAARAAGQELNGGTQASGNLGLDTAAAAQSARAFLRTAAVAGTVSVSGTTITVQTRVEKPAAFLSLLGLSRVAGIGTATATPESSGGAP